VTKEEHTERELLGKITLKNVTDQQWKRYIYLYNKYLEDATTRLKEKYEKNNTNCPTDIECKN
jgi:hypothetical protein